MSTNSELRERLARLGPVRVESQRPLSSAEAEAVLLRVEQAGHALIPVMHSLRAAGLTLRQAHGVINDLAVRGAAVCGLRRGTDLSALAGDLRPLGVSVARRATAEIGAAWIAGLRARHGLSQRDLADRLGIDLRTLQNWEQGRNRPDAAAISLIRLFDRDPALVLDAVYERATP